MLSQTSTSFQIGWHNTRKMGIPLLRKQVGEHLNGTQAKEKPEEMTEFEENEYLRKRRMLF